MITIREALLSLVTTDTAYSIKDGKIESWDMSEVKSNTPQPLDSEITAEISRLQGIYDSQEYARDRAEAYPSLTEQADMAYWDRQNGTTTLDDAISAVKLQFPKG